MKKRLRKKLAKRQSAMGSVSTEYFEGWIGGRKVWVKYSFREIRGWF